MMYWFDWGELTDEGWGCTANSTCCTCHPPALTYKREDYWQEKMTQVSGLLVHFSLLLSFQLPYSLTHLLDSYSYPLTLLVLYSPTHLLAYSLTTCTCTCTRTCTCTCTCQMCMQARMHSLTHYWLAAQGLSALFTYSVLKRAARNSVAAEYPRAVLRPPLQGQSRRRRGILRQAPHAMPFFQLP